MSGGRKGASADIRSLQHDKKLEEDLQGATTDGRKRGRRRRFDKSKII